MKSSIVFNILFVSAAVTRHAFGSEIYSLDFTPPETGSYQTVFGHPAIQGSVGAFNDALVFDAVTGYEQIRLDVGNIAPRYDIEFDVTVHDLLSSEYAFGIFLDFDPNLTRFQSVHFHGGLNSIHLFSPSGVGGNVGGFSNDQVYHLDIALDFHAKTWSLDINGGHAFSSGIDGPNLQSIRFSMAPWVGGAVDDPGNYAAIDNVVVTAIPEPSSFALMTAAVLAAKALRRHRVHIQRCPISLLQ